MGKRSNLIMVTFALALLVIVSGQDSNVDPCPPDVVTEFKTCQAKLNPPITQSSSKEEICRYWNVAIECQQIKVQKCELSYSLAREAGDVMQKGFIALEQGGCEISEGGKTVGSTCPPDAVAEFETCQAKLNPLITKSSSRWELCRYGNVAIECMKIQLQKCELSSSSAREADDTMQKGIIALKQLGCYRSAGGKTVGSIATVTIVMIIMFNVVVGMTT